MHFYKLHIRRWLALMLVLLIGAMSPSAFARDILLPVQGLLTDAQRAPIDGQVEVTFKLYGGLTDTQTVWSETRMMQVDQGLFTTYMGQTNPLGSELTLQHDTLYFTMTITGDTETDRVPLAHALMAARAEHAIEAQTLQGKSLDQIEQRPTSAQTTTYDNVQSTLSATTTQAALDEIVARLKTLEADNTALKTKVQTLEAINAATRLQTIEATQQNYGSRLSSVEQTLMALQNQLNTTTQTVSTFNSRISAAEMGLTSQASRISTVEMTTSSLTTRITSAESTLNSLSTTVGQLDTRVTTAQNLANSNKSRLDGVEPTVASHTSSINSLNGRAQSLETKTSSMTNSADGKQVYFTGVNLHVRSGSGSTTGVVNGTGNLILGYDEARTVDSQKTGSHNLVLGRRNNYTSYAGIVGGNDNSITGTYSVAITGDNGTASGPYSAIISGTGGLASNTSSAILTGHQNKSTGLRSSVAGGWYNDAQGSWSSILGGDYNVAVAADSSIGGGDYVTANTTLKFAAEGTLTP